MTEDKLAFLDQPRDDAGRFASKAEQQAAEAPSTPEPTPQQSQEPAAQAPSIDPPKVEPSAQNVPPGYIPLAAQLDEREKRQKIERELEELRRKFDEATHKPEEQIDPITDPEAWDRRIREELARTRWDTITSVSHSFALKQYGPDAVKAAEEWLAEELKQNPAYFQSVQRQSDPYDFVVRQHKKHLRDAKLGDETDLDAAFEKWATERGYQKPTQQQASASPVRQPSPQSTPLPTPSLASAPSAGGNAPKIPLGPGIAFDAVFK